MRWRGLSLVIGAAALVYVVLGLLQPMPSVFPDEFLYGHLARSLADGDGFSWRGNDQSLHAALYVYAITPAWALLSTVDAYHVAKAFGAVICSLTAVPVWILARRFVTPGLALAAAALSLAGTWMVWTASLMTETLALPLATSALVATVIALQKPSPRTSMVALAFAVLATWARLQLIVLIPVIFAAHLVDIARFGREWRSRAGEHRVALLLGGGILLAGVLTLAVAGKSAVGLYSQVLDYRPSIGLVLRKTGLQLIQLTAASGFLPALLAFALALQRRAWRDPVIGPLLVVVTTAGLGFALESGFFLAGVDGVPWGIERYVMYVAPLLIVLLVVAVATFELPARTFGIAALGAIALLLAPGVRDFSEETAMAATTRRLQDVVPSIGTGLSLCVAGLVLSGIAFYLHRRRAGWSAARVTSATCALVLATLLVVSGSAWQLSLRLQRAERANFPHSWTWVDDHSREPVAVLEVTANNVGFEQYDFFNRRFERYYATSSPVPGWGLQGRVCSWTIGSDGIPKFDSSCGSHPRRFFVNDARAHVRFYDERDVVEDRDAGRLVTADGNARVRSVVLMPCARKSKLFKPPWGDPVPSSSPRKCTNVLVAYVWADGASELIVHVRGGDGPHVAQYKERQFQIAPRRETTLRLPIARGAVAAQLILDWDTAGPGLPEITRVDVSDGGSTYSAV